MTAVKKVFKTIGDCIVDAFKKLPYAFYVLVHPFDGFYDLKNDPKRKSVNTAVLLMILLAFSAVFKRQLLGYMYTSVAEQLSLNVILEIGIAILPYILWTVANWCFSSLMDGDGKFEHILFAKSLNGQSSNNCRIYSSRQSKANPGCTNGVDEITQPLNKGGVNIFYL